MAVVSWIIFGCSVVCLLGTAVDGAIWPGITCRASNMYVLDDEDTSVYYQCSNGRPYKMACYTGLSPCIGAKCNKPAGPTMYCTWLANCHRPVVPVKNPCASQPCHNGGSCERLSAGRYRCECVVGFGGAKCEKVIDVVTFRCQNGVETMPTPGVTSPSPSNDTFVEEDCKTWCFVRENSVEQSITRGCWYPELFAGVPATVSAPVKGCGFFDDKLVSTLPATDQLMCFCRRGDGQCNTGSVDSLIDKLPFIESL